MAAKTLYLIKCAVFIGPACIFCSNRNTVQLNPSVSNIDRSIELLVCGVDSTVSLATPMNISDINSD